MYKTEIRNLELKHSQTPKQLRLWHGTRKNNPIQIYTHDGLNINYASEGYWGKGIYFAVNASYSCPNWSYPCG